MIEETSIEAYRELIPVLGLIHRRICEWMIGNTRNPQLPPPWTANEIQAGINEPDAINGWVGKRMPELYRSRMVILAGTQYCRVTGRRAIAWDLPTTAPEFVRPIKSGRTQSQRINLAVERLLDLRSQVRQGYSLTRTEVLASLDRVISSLRDS